jgi:hypothetical protein
MSYLVLRDYFDSAASAAGAAAASVAAAAGVSSAAVDFSER